MHNSAKRGLAIACRPSVYLSVTLVDSDHIGWNTLKIIIMSGLIMGDLVQREHPKNTVE